MTLVWMCAVLLLAPLSLGFSKPTSGRGKSGAGGKRGPVARLAELWDTRDQADHAETLVRECEKLLAKDPDHYEAHWQIARACWWISDRSSDSEVKQDFGLKGSEHGEKAVALNPDGVEGYTWCAAALGEYGLGINIVKALLKGLDGKFRKHCQAAIEIDSAYDGGAPLRAMGRFYAKLPFPKQDLRRSRELLEEAVKIAPERGLSRLYLVDTLLALGRPEEAVPHLESVLKGKCCAAEKADRDYFIARALELCKGVPGGDALIRKYGKK